MTMNRLIQGVFSMLGKNPGYKQSKNLRKTNLWTIQYRLNVTEM